jgi:AcrR family transcriptional regulator
MSHAGFVGYYVGMGESVSLRERKKQETRNRILTESARLFAQQGYVATTLDQIAEAANISVPTLVAYFSSKDRLVTSTEWRLVEDLRRRLDDPARDADTIEIWRRYVDEHATYAQDNRHTFLTTMRLALDTPELRTTMLGVTAALEDAIAAGLAADLGPDALRQPPTRFIPSILAHGNRVTLHQWIDDGGNGDLRAETLAVIDFVETTFTKRLPRNDSVLDDGVSAVRTASPVMASLARRYDVVKPHLTERQRRVWLGAEARELGSGGVRIVADAVRVSPDTVRRGRDELDDPQPLEVGRSRSPGGGRKRADEADLGLAAALDELNDPESRGDRGSRDRSESRAETDSPNHSGGNTP